MSSIDEHRWFRDRNLTDKQIAGRKEVLLYRLQMAMLIASYAQLTPLEILQVLNDVQEDLVDVITNPKALEDFLAGQGRWNCAVVTTPLVIHSTDPIAETMLSFRKKETE